MEIAVGVRKKTLALTKPQMNVSPRVLVACCRLPLRFFFFGEGKGALFLWCGCCFCVCERERACGTFQACLPLLGEKPKGLNRQTANRRPEEPGAHPKGRGKREKRGIPGHAQKSSCNCCVCVLCVEGGGGQHERGHAQNQDWNCLATKARQAKGKKALKPSPAAPHREAKSWGQKGKALWGEGELFLWRGPLTVDTLPPCCSGSV